MGILAGDYIHRQHRQHIPEHTSWLGPGSHCRDELLREFMAEWAPGLLCSPDSQCGRAVDTGPAPERRKKWRITERAVSDKALSDSVSLLHAVLDSPPYYSM